MDIVRKPTKTNTGPSKKYSTLSFKISILTFSWPYFMQRNEETDPKLMNSKTNELSVNFLCSPPPY